MRSVTCTVSKQKKPGSSVVVSGKNKVSPAKGNGKVIQFSNQTILRIAGMEFGDTFNITSPDAATMVLEKSTNGTNTISKNKGKSLVDIRKLAEDFKVGVSIKITALKDKIIITVHHEDIAVSDREEQIKERLDDGKEVRVATLFSGRNMREMLKRSGLVQLSNDLSCKMAIEIERTHLESAMARNPQYWQKSSVAAVNNVTNIDFSQVDLPGIDGLIADVSGFNVAIDRKAGKSRNLSADDDCDDSGALFLSIMEVLKRGNPAFVNIEASWVDSQKKEHKEGLLTLITLFDSVLNSLGYNVNKELNEIEGKQVLSLLAISENLSKDDLNSSSLVSVVDVKEPVMPTMLSTDSNVYRIDTREKLLVDMVKSNKPLRMGSMFSGGGVMDLAVHTGLADMGISSFCKFGMEWNEDIANANLSNNLAIWNELSDFLIGDARGINVHKYRTAIINGLVMGIPCVGASLSGLAKNKLKVAEEHLTAGALFVNALEVIKCSNPAFIVLENVPNYQNITSMTILRQALNHLGYDVSENIYSGNQYGAFEDRDRWVLVATSKGLFKDDDEVLTTLPSVAEKPADLSGLLSKKSFADTSWRYPDYLYAKEKSDIAKGKGFRMQLLHESSPMCGTIGAGYAKCRSTEPMVRFSLDYLYEEYHQRLVDDGLTEDLLVGCVPDFETLGLYFNLTKAQDAKLVKRSKEQSKEVPTLYLLETLEDCKKLAGDCTFTLRQHLFQALSENHKLLNEFIEITYAISKSTRLLDIQEHARVKAIPEHLVNGLNATSGHMLLGNSVVFTLFQALGRRLACWTLNATHENGVLLVSSEDMESILDSIVDGKYEESGEVYSIVRNTTSAYFVKQSNFETDAADLLAA